MPSFYPEKIPSEMKIIPHWVLWKLEEVIDKDTGEPETNPKTGEIKLTKVPYQTNGKKADTTKSETWTNFEEALAAYNPSIHAGLGFVLTADTGIVAVDFDHVLHDKYSSLDACTYKAWDEEVYFEIENFNSYAEISQSGEGAHVFCKGTLPKAGRKKGNREMYCDNRFFAVTGDHLFKTPETINEAQECISDYYTLWFEEEQTTDYEISTNLKSPVFSDEEIIRLASTARNSEKFLKLHSGDITDYHSSSEADFAYCRILAFYTQNKKQIDAIYRTSGLYNKKWDRRGKYTLNKVIINLPAVYQNHKKRSFL